MTAPTQHDTIRAVAWVDDQLQLLDQRVLPQRTEFLKYSDAASVAQAIRDMVVRGAPAIGITAAYGIVLAARDAYARKPGDWKGAMADDLRKLAESRPTAVNLFWAIKRMQATIATLERDPVPALLAEAQRIHDEDVAANRRMGALGAELIATGSGILTHCNTGSLATGGYGTALGVIRSAFATGKVAQVYADETRPWLQGARLTAWELVQDRIPVTLLADGAAGYLMKLGRVQWVIVGADRITANGDTANKIGTYSAAVNAKHHGVKFMVVAPTSTIDMSLADGGTIPIEQRPKDEVFGLGGRRVAAAGADAWNPSFDVTPAELIDAIVTEKGVVHAPTRERMRALVTRREV
jgi:methylthioribose-1-phosphate isomerase